MPGASRLMDKSQATSPHPHGCPGCPHPSTGPAISGSGDVLINKKPAFREQDNGMAMACCGPNTWKATKGSATVKINSKGAMRQNDMTTHCESFPGKMVEGSSDVIIGG